VSQVVPRVVSVLDAFPNDCFPVQLLVSMRSDDEADETVIEPPRETDDPLTVMEPPPVRRELPMVVVATSLPFASVLSSALPIPSQVVPKVVSVLELLVKELSPVHVLLFASKVVEATEIEVPARNGTPLTVPNDPVR